ncbi:MAG: hypothetical protein ACHQHN_11870 [Sphingobacteriales bacterium]
MQITGSATWDSSTALNLTNGASDYGRTQLRLTGRIQASNDGWGINGRNNIIFSANANASGTGVGTIGVDKLLFSTNA